MEETIQIKIKSLQSEPEWDEKIIIYHEVAHHVWFTKLDTQTRVDWYVFHNEHKDSMPTQYGKGLPSMTETQAAHEGFAECYAYLKFNPFSCDREVRKFFTKKWFDPEITEPET